MTELILYFLYCQGFCSSIALVGFYSYKNEIELLHLKVINDKHICEYTWTRHPHIPPIWNSLIACVIRICKCILENLFIHFKHMLIYVFKSYIIVSIMIWYHWIYNIDPLIYNWLSSIWWGASSISQNEMH